jgi:UDP-glucose 6-dehydrogenase
LRAVHAAADDSARIAKKPVLVVVKSTVPVRTCDAVQARVSTKARVPLEQRGRAPAVIDARSIWRPAGVMRAGLRCRDVGMRG